MKNYEIRITPDAIDDLTALRDYIVGVLGAPMTAQAYLKKLRAAIAALSTMPDRYQLVEDEPWHSRVIRRMLIKNSFIYYRVDESAKKVYILNVIYGRRNQLVALAEKWR